MIRCLSLVAALFLAGEAAAACSDRIDLTDDQIDRHFATLESGEAGALDKIRAYNELCRATDSAVRALADEAALASGSDALRSSLLPALLLERETLILQPYDTGDLSKGQKAWIEGNPPVSLTFSFKDEEAACIGLYYGECRANYVLDYSGSGVSIALSGAVGELALSDAGALGGLWVPAATSLRIPVQARLR